MLRHTWVRGLRGKRERKKERKDTERKREKIREKLIGIRLCVLRLGSKSREDAGGSALGLFKRRRNLRPSYHRFSTTRFDRGFRLRMEAH